jgi:hypothetical protein
MKLGKILTLKRFLKTKLTFERIILLVIFLIVLIPYILKGYQVLQAWRQEQIRVENQKRINAKREPISKENQRRSELLLKYDINELEKKYPCKSSYECVLEVKIPKAIFSYLFWELKDKRLGSDVVCKKSAMDDRYIKYCPNQPFGVCRIDLSDLYSGNKSPSPKPTSAAMGSFVADLRKGGYDEQEASTLSYTYKGKLYFSLEDKCGRLNFKSNYEEFEEEVPRVDKLVKENSNEEFIKRFRDTDYKNYLILRQELSSEN